MELRSYTEHIIFNPSLATFITMPKRSWNQVDGAATQPTRRGAKKASTKDIHIKSGSPGSPDDVNVNFSHPPTPTLTDAGSEPRSAKSEARQRAASTHSDDNEQIAWPSITRKVKACAACRKQKVRRQSSDKRFGNRN